MRHRGSSAALCRFVIGRAKEHRFAGIQFNAVAERNHRAVDLYQRLGFEITGTVPDAFRHPTLGRVSPHVMYCEF
ncbi:GNAT family N-acetyltransferase [Nocardia sp. NPDC050412]|uniref:GNAT family N-acetyltransferase n=1 Tax=Nocardia sp. NPDC050412 TaxID=3364320 RepID=UPI0037A24BFB